MQNPYKDEGARYAFEGLNRCLDVLDYPELVDAQIGVGQGLFWAVSLDDRLGRKFADYRSVRNADDEGHCADGARLARNAIVHGAAVMQTYQPGLSFPIALPMSVGGWRWRPLAEVLNAWPDRLEPPVVQKESYSTHFPGSQPGLPIALFRNWLLRAPDLGFLL